MLHRTAIILISFLLILTKVHAQSITNDNAYTMAIMETDSMRAKLNLDSVQIVSVRNIQIRYYDSIAGLSVLLGADDRKESMQRYQAWRSAALESVLSPLQWNFHQKYIDEKRALIEKKIQQRRMQHAGAGN